MASIWGNPFSAQSYGGGPSGGSLFYNPQSTYGAPKSYSNTPLGGLMREKNPQLAFTQYVGNMGVADNDSLFNRFVLSQFPKFERGYQQATLQNPFLKIDDYLRTLPGLAAFQQQYLMAPAQQRGVEYANYAPQIRHMMR